MDFVARHDLWTDAEIAMAVEIEKRIQKDGLELIRFSFADQHGVLRGKTIVAADALSMIRGGCSITSTLLTKDTANRNVFSVFQSGGGFGMPEMEGGADLLLIPDPATFRVLPWASRTGWLLCDLYFPNGKPVPFSTRQICQKQLDELARKGFEYVSGLEVEFHIFKLEDSRLRLHESGQPGEPPEVSLTTQGYQYLTELRYDQLDPILELLRGDIVKLGLPLRSLEVELGPSQCEFTFRPELGIASADSMMLFRSAIKQICRRNGYHATFMCRPQVPNIISSGWHLHESLIETRTKQNAFAGAKGELLSSTGYHFLGGLLAHATAITAFAVPTINGYKRFRPYSLAPDRAIWGRDNRGAMVRVIGSSGDARLENRIGEPAANPYLYIGSQVAAGLDGIEQQTDPGPSADTPYETSAPQLPGTLGEALDALNASSCIRSAFGNQFIEYFIRIKSAELERFRMAVTDWEQREYFDLF